MAHQSSKKKSLNTLLTYLENMVVISGMKRPLKNYYQKDIRMNIHLMVNSLKKMTSWMSGSIVVPHGLVSYKEEVSNTHPIYILKVVTNIEVGLTPA